MTILSVILLSESKSAEIHTQQDLITKSPIAVVAIVISSFMECLSELYERGKELQDPQHSQEQV